MFQQVESASSADDQAIDQEGFMNMSATKLPMSDSVFACFFLSLYVGIYMTAGFLGLRAVEWAWVKLLG
jgi:hypothetical protein